MSDDQNVSTVAGQVSISSQMLSRAVAQRRALDEAYNHALLHPPTWEQLAALRAKREAIWDAMTAQSIVGISDWGDDEPSWHEVKRGDCVDKWVPIEAWAAYLGARRKLNEAETALEQSEVV